jgi:acyl-CoA thioesterase-1
MPFISAKFKSLFPYVPWVLAMALFIASCQNSENPGASKVSSTPSSTPSPTNSEKLPVIVAFGDSLTAGFGLPREQSFTELLQGKLDEKGFRYRVINAGVSGDTSAGGVRRIDWALEGEVKVLILELGGNDALRGQPVSEMKKNLSQIIERAQSRGATVILAGMEAPPNMGEEYTRDFRQAYRDLAARYKVAFIPFLLDGVGGNPELNQPDGIHPNAEGEKIMTENVWKVLEKVLEKP